MVCFWPEVIITFLGFCLLDKCWVIEGITGTMVLFLVKKEMTKITNAFVIKVL